MPEYNDDDNEQYQETSEGMAALRKADRAKAKALKELQAKFDLATAEIAKHSEASAAQKKVDMLTAKGVDPGVSKFLKDVDATDEALDAWLAENGKLIGYDPTKGASSEQTGEEESSGETHQEPQETEAMAQLRVAMARVQTEEANAAPGLLGGSKGLDAIHKLGDNAKSFEDVVKGLQDMKLVP